MKKIYVLGIALMLSGAYCAAQTNGTSQMQTSQIQTLSAADNDALSAKYKDDMKILAAEMKAIKVKLKTNKNDAMLKSELKLKQAQYKDIKSKKDKVDTIIKTEKASAKAMASAEKAQAKAKKASANAEKAAKKAAAAKKY